VCDLRRAPAEWPSCRVSYAYRDLQRMQRTCLRHPRFLPGRPSHLCSLPSGSPSGCPGQRRKGLDVNELPWTWPVDLLALSAAPEGTVTFGLVLASNDWPEEVVEFHNCRGLPIGGPLDSRWTIVSREPLTVSPSIWCKPPGGCGLHGWIRDGKWVSA
jgi:hypothetical protein